MNSEIAYAIGFILTAAGVGVISSSFGFTSGFMRLIVIIIAGIGGGVAGQYLYKSMKNKKQ